MIANGFDEIDAVNMADSERVILDQDKEQEHKEKFTRLQKHYLQDFDKGPYTTSKLLYFVSKLVTQNLFFLHISH